MIVNFIADSTKPLFHGLGISTSNACGMFEETLGLNIDWIIKLFRICWVKLFCYWMWNVDELEVSSRYRSRPQNCCLMCPICVFVIHLRHLFVIIMYISPCGSSWPCNHDCWPCYHNLSLFNYVLWLLGVHFNDVALTSL